VSGPHPRPRRFGIFGRKFDAESRADLNQLLDEADQDARRLARRACLEIWTPQDGITVGVDMRLNVVIGCAGDKTVIDDVDSLVDAIYTAERYAEQAAQAAAEGGPQAS
jgi:hypothetical protein